MTTMYKYCNKGGEEWRLFITSQDCVKESEAYRMLVASYSTLSRAEGHFQSYVFFFVLVKKSARVGLVFG